MTIKTVKAAAACRGIFFDGLKTWQNNIVGFGYFVFIPGGRGFIQADTLSGLYKRILEYPKTTKWLIIKPHHTQFKEVNIWMIF